MKIIIIFVSFLCSIGNIYAQIQVEENPRSFSLTTKIKTVSDLPIFLMESFDVEAYKLSVKNNKALRFAKPFAVNINVKENGLKEELGDGTIWRLAVKSAEAYTLNLIFSKYKLEKGSRLHLYNPNRTEVLGAFSDINNPISTESNPNTSFAVQPIQGDEIIVELFEPFENSGSVCVIGKVNHDFIGYSGGTFGNSCSDQVDVICSEGDNWRKEINSSCFLIINGFDACSAALINNTNEDGKSLILTANHCYDFNPPKTSEENSNSAANTIIVFNYDSPWCNGSNGINTHTVSGAVLRANSRNTDFLLLEANNIIPTSFYPYHSGWNRDGTQLPNGVGIHHPSIDVKKISTHSQTPNNSNCMQFRLPSGILVFNIDFWGLTSWDITTNGHSLTERGSSGSPLYNSNKRIIGQLFGPGVCSQFNCTNNNGDKRLTSNFSNYGKVEKSWDGNGTPTSRLKDWLYPTLILPEPTECLGLRFIRFYTVNHNARLTGDVVKFHDVNIITGYNVIVTELQERFEATGFLIIPAGSTFQVY